MGKRIENFKGTPAEAIHILNRVLNVLRNNTIEYAEKEAGDKIGLVLYLGYKQMRAIQYIVQGDASITYDAKANRIYLYDFPIVPVCEEDYAKVTVSLNLKPVVPVDNT